MLKNIFNKLKRNKISKSLPLISNGINLNKKLTTKSNAEIFSKFTLFEGNVSSFFDAGYYGNLIRRSFYSWEDYPSDTFHEKSLPMVNEEYFEWIDLLESIDLARDHFTMIELGAGYGRWLVAAAVIIRNQKNIPFHLTGVEAEYNHYNMMKQHFIDNELDPSKHNLIQAAITKDDTVVNFFQGDSSEWWGQAIATSNAKMKQFPNSKVEEIQGLSINTILKNIEFVDLMDIDIQGEESNAIETSLETLQNKVKRIHIGTHSHSNEETLYNYFSEMGWKCYNNLPCNSTQKTQYGSITFQDGVQTWINPNIQ